MCVCMYVYVHVYLQMRIRNEIWLALDVSTVYLTIFCRENILTTPEIAVSETLFLQSLNLLVHAERLEGLTVEQAQHSRGLHRHR
jgi:hypothetical protein